MRKNRTSIHCSQRVVDAGTTRAVNILAEGPTSGREAALASLSQEGASQERPAWATSDLEDIYCDGVEVICEREEMSWQKFIEQAVEKYPDLPVTTTIRVEVTEYFRDAAGWFQKASQPYAGGLHKPPLVKLQEADVHKLVSPRHDGGGGTSVVVSEVPLRTQWD